MRRFHGFTLIELLAVITIIGILATLAAVGVSNATKRGRDARRISDLQAIKKALEQYYLDNGQYPRSDCGYDCNGYRYSGNATSWNALAVDLAPYISNLPKDPIGKCGGGPWNDGCYSYTYGNVGNTTYTPQYDLTAQLEYKKNPERCEVKNYRLWMNGVNPWCTAFGGAYSNQIYEASPL